MLLVEKEYIEATKGNQLMKQYVASNSNGDDEIASTLKEIRIAKRELQNLLKKVNSRAQMSSLIDKKYSLYRNRFILRTGEIPEMELMEKPYADVSFLRPVENEGVESVNDKMENEVVTDVESDEVTDVENEEAENEVVTDEVENEVTDVENEEAESDEVTDEVENAVVTDVENDEVNEDVQSVSDEVTDIEEYDSAQEDESPDSYMNPEDETYPDDYDERYEDDYDHYDAYDDAYDETFDNPNPNKEPEEYDLEVDSQFKFSIDFPVRHSHPLAINVVLLDYTHN